MEQSDVFHRLRTNQQKLEHFPIQSLALFGSVARNEARPDSDVDILVEFTADAHVGLFEFVRLQRLLSDILGAPVDLATPDALRKELREQILAEAIHLAWKLRITDILDAIAAIREYTMGMEYEEFAHDRKTVDAVLRSLMIIGEAVNHVPEEVTQRYPEIPWAEMSGMRNVVVHIYFGVNLQIIWDTIRRNLPLLIESLEVLL